MRDKDLEILSDIEKRVFKRIQRFNGDSLSSVIDRVSRELGLPRERASLYIYKLWKKGFIDLERPGGGGGLLNYIFSIEAGWFHITTLVIIFTVLTIFLVTEPPLIYIRYILGSLYVLYLPGAALIEALYPRGDELEPLERLALSIGLSLALVPLIGLILNYTPWGIRLTPVTLSLALVTEILIIYALYRKYIYFRMRYI